MLLVGGYTKGYFWQVCSSVFDGVGVGRGSLCLASVSLPTNQPDIHNKNNNRLTGLVVL